MKKILLLITFALVLMVATGTVLAKESKPKRVAENIPWNLSGAVMPVPPYGLVDVIGSDTASKLTVKQAKDDKPFKINGKMSGLTPNTTYTVFISKPYEKYSCTSGWNINGSWKLAFNSTMWASGNPYMHDMVVTGGTATGGTPAGGTYVNSWNATVSVVGDAVTIVANYLPGSGVYPYTFTAIGTIALGGTMSGTWTDATGDSGTWTSAIGLAIKSCTGSTGYPGLLTSTIQPFTFTTNAEGKGKWKVKVKDSDVERPTGFSVWINGGGATILISDNGMINVGVPKPPKPPKK